MLQCWSNGQQLIGHERSLLSPALIQLSELSLPAAADKHTAVRTMCWLLECLCDSANSVTNDTCANRTTLLRGLYSDTSLGLPM